MTIFVSHSQRDTEHLSFLNQAFSTTPNVDAKYEEIEAIDGDPRTADRIEKDIHAAECVFVILTENVATEPRMAYQLKAAEIAAKQKERTRPPVRCGVCARRWSPDWPMSIIAGKPNETTVAVAHAGSALRKRWETAPISPPVTKAFIAG